MNLLRSRYLLLQGILLVIFSGLCFKVHSSQIYIVFQGALVWSNTILCKVLDREQTSYNSSTDNLSITFSKISTYTIRMDVKRLLLSLLRRLLVFSIIIFIIIFVRDKYLQMKSWMM